MAYKCEICNKGVMFGHNVSHAKNRTRRIFKPNLRKAKLRLNGEVKRVKICMKCLKKAKKDGRYLTPYEAKLMMEKQKMVLRETKEALRKAEEIAKSLKEEKEKRPKAGKKERKIEEIVGRK